nr:uncharacterized protein LOC112022154 [Quercus suber]
MAIALNRFISRSADRCCPFFQLLHKWKGFQWTEKCVLAFKELKKYLSCPSVLSRPEKEEVLYAYLAVTDFAISLVLVKNESGVQKAVYYVSKSLHEAETHYLPLEKAVLAIIHATRKLPHYLQAHTMVVLTQLPLQALLRKSDYTGRISKWGTMLGAYDVKYMLRTAIKGKVLADFMAEFIESEVYTDGATNQKGAGVRVVLIILEKLVMEKSLRFGFLAINNEAEYKALLARMRYPNKVRQAWVQFKSFTLKQIPRGQNSHANSLAMLATSLGSNLPRVVIVEDMASSSLVKKPLVGVHSIQVRLSWMDPLVTFLKQGLLLEDKGKTEKIRRKDPRYWLSKEQKLYICSHSELYLLCVHPEVVEPLLEELHKGICGSHIGGRFLAHGALTQGYWWPNMQRTFQDCVRKCDQCQRWLLVGTNYFTKWVEVEPLSNIRDVDAKSFIWRNIITKIGVPHTLISDNGLQFDNKTLRIYYEKLGIRNTHSTPAYQQWNGQVEATNKAIVSGLKKRLDDANLFNDCGVITLHP